MLFYREEGAGRGYYKQRVHWRKLGAQSVVAFHWLSITVSHWLGCCQAERNSSFLRMGGKEQLSSYQVCN